MQLTSSKNALQDSEQDMSVECAARLMLEIEARLNALRAIPAENLAKVRLHWPVDGRVGVIGSVVFLDHLLASVQFNLTRLRLSTDIRSKLAPKERR